MTHLTLKFSATKDALYYAQTTISGCSRLSALKINKLTPLTSQLLLPLIGLERAFLFLEGRVGTRRALELR